MQRITTVFREEPETAGSRADPIFRTPQPLRLVVCDRRRSRRAQARAANGQQRA
jgi:hypothetical protein